MQSLSVYILQSHLYFYRVCSHILAEPPSFPDFCGKKKVFHINDFCLFASSLRFFILNYFWRPVFNKR